MISVLTEKYCVIFVVLWALALGGFNGVATAAGAGHAIPHYVIAAEVFPAEGRLRAEVELRFPAQRKRVLFGLNPELSIDAIQPTPSFVTRESGKDFNWYTLTYDESVSNIRFTYNGQLNEPPRQDSREIRSFESTRGVIGNEGVFLSASTGWYPVLAGEYLSFELTTTLPSGWQSVSQGKQVAEHQWQEFLPQQEIYLIAGRFQAYTRQMNDIELQIWLRAPDASLAEQYLDASQRYITMYGDLLGKYPYSKFALIENFWETGYGMPSFTLMGAKVIRFPFILHTSFPHEVLHNWWGNGVYVDYSGGNWSEGLTSYLADHALKELQGGAVEYRRGVLQKYMDFAANSRDFALTEFTARHDPATEAVGYGKAMMFFHMLRQQLGEQAFIKGLRRFYAQHRFEEANYEAIISALEAESGTNLTQASEQWLQRSGAPRLTLTNVESAHEASGNYSLSFTLQQSQGGKPYLLQIPVYVLLTGDTHARRLYIDLSKDEQHFTLTFETEPRWLAIDPEYDLFRQLQAEEIPPALGQMYASQSVTFVLPARMRKMPEIHHSLTRPGGYWQTVSIVYDDQVDALPEDQAVWVFGWDNRLRQKLGHLLTSVGAVFDEEGVTVNDDKALADRHSVAVVTYDEARRPVVWTATPDDSIPMLARKLPHYSKFSYVVFDNGSLNNRLKITWPVGNTPLKTSIDKSLTRSVVKLSPREPLILE